MDIEVIKKQLRGLRLKELRISPGVERRKILKNGNSHIATMENWKGDFVNPTIETLTKLCDIFNVTLSDLFLFMNDDKNASEEREQVIVKLAKLLKDNRKTKINKLKIFLDEIL